MRTHGTALKSVSRLTLVAALALAATAAHAQTASADTTPTAAPSAPTTPPPGMISPELWTIRLEPQVWYVGPEGDLTMPGSAAGVPPVKLSALHAEDPEASLAGQVTIRVPHLDDKGEPDRFWKSGWFFSISGASFAGNSEGNASGAGFTIGSLTVAGGASVSTDVEWSTFQAVVGKWVAGSDFDSGGTTRIDLFAVAGARVHTQEISVSSGGDTTDASESFGAIVLGARLDVKLPAGFSAEIDVNANFWPGDPSCVGFEIAPTFVWNPTDNIGVQIGYRLLIADCESGSEGDSDYYRLDGSLAGLFAGVEIRF